MKLHLRVQITNSAKYAVALHLGDIVIKHDLTDAEVIAILAEEIQERTKYMIRIERHRDANKPGGLADD